VGKGLEGEKEFFIRVLRWMLRKIIRQVY